MDKAIKGMLANLDPYTVYFNEQDVGAIQNQQYRRIYWNRRLLTRKEDKLIVKEAYKIFLPIKQD
jgi:carboxyl-terminal processing protease